MSDKTLPYDPIWSALNEIGTLSEAIEHTCLMAIQSRDECNPEYALYLIRNAAQTIGLIADHCIGGDMRGDATKWFHLPDMEKSGSDS